MTLTHAERIEILEKIARDPDVPASARVTAIRTLNEIRGEEGPESDAFADLYELGVRRKARRSAPSASQKRD